MSESKLPERASLEYLKKLAKDRLQQMRQADPAAKLAMALLAVARDHGYSSWRALKSAVEQRQTENVLRFFDACATGDIKALRGLVADQADLVRTHNPQVTYRGWTGLHSAAKAGFVEAVRLLLDHGADPNAREAGDHSYPLHWAAAHGHLDTVRALLDAGGDVHGFGDLHELDVIGWATYFRKPGDIPWDVVTLLLERGARHHIISAIAVGDLQLVRTLVEQNPEELDRRLSRFDQGQSVLHVAVSRQRYDVLDLLIELGADLEAVADTGQTALAVAMLRGDREAMKRLHAAGAKQPATTAPANFTASMAGMGQSIIGASPMLVVPDVAKALAWYTSIGFTEVSRHEGGGLVDWGLLSFGKAQIMLTMGGKAGRHDVILWFYTDQVDRLYELFKARQLETSQAALAGDSAVQEGMEIAQDVHDPFYGGREFSIRDLNGYVLFFRQPDK